MSTTILYRPVGQREYELIEASGFRRFPPRLPEQPFFYPVANEEYATQVARDWNTRDEASGYAVPADELEEFNESTDGPIECVCLL